MDCYVYYVPVWTLQQTPPDTSTVSLITNFLSWPLTPFLSIPSACRQCNQKFLFGNQNFQPVAKLVTTSKWLMNYFLVFLSFTGECRIHLSFVQVQLSPHSCFNEHIRLRQVCSGFTKILQPNSMQQKSKRPFVFLDVSRQLHLEQWTSWDASSCENYPAWIILVAYETRYPP